MLRLLLLLVLYCHVTSSLPEDRPPPLASLVRGGGGPGAREWVWLVVVAKLGRARPNESMSTSLDGGCIVVEQCAETWSGLAVWKYDLLYGECSWGRNRGDGARCGASCCSMRGSGEEFESLLDSDGHGPFVLL